MQFTDKLLPKNLYGGYLKPEGVIVHYMSAINADKIGLDNSDPYDVDVCIDILKYYKVSAHVLIDRFGRKYRCVPFDRIAWHAGASLLNGRAKCNDWCLSVELLSTGKPGIDGVPAYEIYQLESCIELLQDWQRQFGIEKRNVAGHDLVRQNAIDAGVLIRGQPPAKKYDPGPHFPWHRVAEAL